MDDAVEPSEDLYPPRRILLVVTIGGLSHATPVLNLGSILAVRGHEVHFATISRCCDWPSAFPFLAAVHYLGPGIDPAATADVYSDLRNWRPEDGMAKMIAARRVFDTVWPQAYDNLRELLKSSEKPDFIVADFFAEDLARDMMAEFKIQIAVVWPQMPYHMARASYIPGIHGFQHDTALTSEHSSIWSRLRNELIIAKALPSLLGWKQRTARMRATRGLEGLLPILTKPDYLILVNSFYGIETPKDLPPLIVPVGPVLSDKYQPLSPELAMFLDKHKNVIYVSFGTHIKLNHDELDKIREGLTAAVGMDFIDGIVYASGSDFPFESNELLRNGSSNTRGKASHYQDNTYFQAKFLPQRSILEHSHTRLFLTHGGSSSTNEAIYHGTPVISIGFFFDQLCNSARLAVAGVGVSLDKATFTAMDVADAIGNIRLDADRSFERNVLRMKRIAHRAAKRKHLAVDMIEEVMYDNELRRDLKGVEQSPMHLQTADARMSTIKARNWDLSLVVLSGLAFGGLAGWWAIRTYTRNF